MAFKFAMGAAVRTRKGVEGTVTARIELPSGPHYRFQGAYRQEYEMPEKSLWMVSRLPGWLKPGEGIQWLGTGAHSVYVVKELYRGGKYHPWSFTAEAGNMWMHS